MDQVQENEENNHLPTDSELQQALQPPPHQFKAKDEILRLMFKDDILFRLLLEENFFFISKYPLNNINNDTNHYFTLVSTNIFFKLFKIQNGQLKLNVLRQYFREHSYDCYTNEITLQRAPIIINIGACINNANVYICNMKDKLFMEEANCYTTFISPIGSTRDSVPTGFIKHDWDGQKFKIPYELNGEIGTWSFYEEPWDI